MRRRWVLAAALAGFLAGCTNTYKFDNASYDSRDAALTAVRADMERTLAGVTPQPHRLGGRILIVIPTRSVFDAHYGGVAGTFVDSEAVGYITDVAEISFLGMTDIVRQGQIFDGVDVVRATNTADEALAGHDYKLWLVARGPQVWQWYLSKDGVADVGSVSMAASPNKIERANSFNASILKAAAALGVKTVALPTPPVVAPPPTLPSPPPPRPRPLK